MGCPTAPETSPYLASRMASMSYIYGTNEVYRKISKRSREPSPCQRRRRTWARSESLRIPISPHLTRTNTDRTTHLRRFSLIRILSARHHHLTGAQLSADVASLAAGCSEKGSRTRTVVPCSDVSSIETEPEWSCTILLTIARPRPVPLGFP